MEALAEVSTKQAWRCGTSSGACWGNYEVIVTYFDPTVTRTHWNCRSTTPPGYYHPPPSPEHSPLIPEVPLRCLNSSARRTKCCGAFGGLPKGKFKAAVPCVPNVINVTSGRASESSPALMTVPGDELCSNHSCRKTKSVLESLTTDKFSKYLTALQVDRLAPDPPTNP